MGLNAAPLLAMNIIALGFNFIFGLAVGSFLNVVALRYTGAGLFNLNRLGGRSLCPHCKRLLHWHELIPVASFIMQGGRCRGCGARISLQYPFIELLTGFAFLLPLFYFYPQYSFPFEHPYREALAYLWLAVAALMILLSAIDWRLMIIPDEINIALAGLSIIFAFLNPPSFLENYASLIPSFAHPLVNHAAGGIVGFAVLSLIVLASRGKAMGMGDVKLAGAMGLLLGFPDIIFALTLAFLAGGAWSMLVVLFRKTGLKTMVPFGPFLVIGFWLHIFFIQKLLAWYFSLL